MLGGSGNDILLGGAGVDTLEGGDGIDRADYSDSAAGLTADLQIAANNTGIAAADSYVSVLNLYGSAHNDTLRGDGGGNTIWGSDGNDYFYGRNGDDRLLGGNGDGNDRAQSVSNQKFISGTRLKGVFCEKIPDCYLLSCN